MACAPEGEHSAWGIAWRINRLQVQTSMVDRRLDLLLQLNKNYDTTFIYKDRTQQLLFEYMQFGGYPRIIFAGIMSDQINYEDEHNSLDIYPFNFGLL
jgi:hypothetical protein